MTSSMFSKVKFLVRRNPGVFFVILAMIILFSFLGYALGQHVQKVRYMQFINSFKNISESLDKYMFINPLIGGTSAPATDIGFFDDIKNEITSYFQQEEKEGNLYETSFYFKDLNTGMWFGVNENANFFPASLFKLPIALAIYKEGEDNGDFLKKIVVYSKEISDMNNAIQENSASTLEVGKSYSVEDLVSIMLTQSDNGAKNLLLSVLDKTYLDRLFNIISMVNPEGLSVIEISSRKYALFFRILYSASYLNEDNSERILGLLSKSSFKEGLVNGVPPDVSVANKFGTYEVTDNSGGKNSASRELHDCGVIYYSESPYLVCIMTRGKDTENLLRIISHVSSLVYSYQKSNDNK